MSPINACLPRLLSGKGKCLPGLLWQTAQGEGQLSGLHHHWLCYDLGDAGGAGMRRPKMESTSAVSFT